MTPAEGSLRATSSLPTRGPCWPDRLHITFELVNGQWTRWRVRVTNAARQLLNIRICNATGAHVQWCQACAGLVPYKLYVCTTPIGRHQRDRAPKVPCPCQRALLTQLRYPNLTTATVLCTAHAAAPQACRNRHLHILADGSMSPPLHRQPIAHTALQPVHAGCGVPAAGPTE